MDEQTPPAWWKTASTLDGRLAALAIDHPDTGLENALNGKYAPDKYPGGGGINQWCDDHPYGDQEADQ